MLQIIQNDPEVPAGNLLDELPVPYRVSHLYRGEPLPALADISGLIVLGGAMGANDEATHPFLAELKGLLREVVAGRVPYLGICLGGQLLATALGAPVVSRRWEELGSLAINLTPAAAGDPLFAGLPATFTTFQWHHDSFDLPPGALLLASSAACPHQAFRVGPVAWGLQFHPEVTESIIRDWCAWDPETAGRVEQLVAAFTANAPAYAALSRLLRRNFLAAAGLL